MRLLKRFFLTWVFDAMVALTLIAAGISLVMAGSSYYVAPLAGLLVWSVASYILRRIFVPRAQ